MVMVDPGQGQPTRFEPADPAFTDRDATERPSPGRRARRGEVSARRRFPVLSAIAALRWLAAAGVLALIAWAAVSEMRTSTVQAMLFSRLADAMTFDVKPGPSDSIQFPGSGPYDQRLGYAALPDFVEALTARGFAVHSQAQWSPDLAGFVKNGGFAVYREKDRAGLRILDRGGEEVYGARFPERIYRDFAAIPDLVVNSLLFVEDRYLLDAEQPGRNPAIEWNRFGLAFAAQVAKLVVPEISAGGASTLATQIEKFRHSPAGLTGSAGDKLRQMVTATTRAYHAGANTLQRRREIVTTYLNATPLASMPGYGEIIGLPDALWVWFGTDHAEATKILNEAPQTAGQLARQGEVYRQVLSLVLSGRRPSYYLLEDRERLGVLTDRFLYALAKAGIITPSLRDAALDAALRFRTEPPSPSAAAVSYVQRKSTEEVRNRLVGLLQLPDLYALDRLDLTVETSVDTEAQRRVAGVLQRLSDPAFLRASGMIGKGLLGRADPSQVTWSFVLYERGEGRNHVRVQADTLNRPFDINSGSKLQLGSTAKLRTTVTYLQVMAELHRQLSPLPARDLARLAASADDELSGWAAAYLARARDRGLQAMLDAAMQRRYSAAPQEFFTGGGTQSFANFSSHDLGAPTVEQAFEQSVNLVFVRMLRDIANYYLAASGVQLRQLLADRDDPRRAADLQRFVDADRRHFLYRFFERYRGLSGAEALDRLAGRIRPVPSKLAAVYLTAEPEARLAHFYRFLEAHLPRMDLSEEELWNNYLSYSPERMSLADRGYVADVHPLELWLVRYLHQHPGASWSEVREASAAARREIYKWLLEGSTYTQNQRIRTILEQDAFKLILENWRMAGFAFGHLVPSLGTAIGASGDRPQALAELMGIILNDGMRLPTASIETLRFASNTPYVTNFVRNAEPQRVMPAEVAQTVRRALTGVVASGTARRINGTFTGPDGAPLEVGGKTGTGDNRFERYAAGGGLLSARAVDRTATFVFFIGDRFFGTATAYVPGEAAEDFDFTSGLAVQLVKVLEPELRPLITEPGPVHHAMVGSSQPDRAVSPPVRLGAAGR